MSPATEDLYDLGVAFAFGTDTTLPNTSKAAKYFEQAAALGHAGACSAAGSLYRWGSEELKQDLEKALGIYLRSVALGTWSDFALIAGIFAEKKQAGVAMKYWNQFFDAARDNYGEVRDRNVHLYGVWYCEAVAAGELEHCVDDSAIVHLSFLLSAGVEMSIAALREDPDRDYRALLSITSNHTKNRWIQCFKGVISEFSVLVVAFACFSPNIVYFVS